MDAAENANVTIGESTEHPTTIHHPTPNANNTT
jgi:hypothetical protein